MVLIGLGAAALIPVQQAYISDQVAYERRGRALASVDISYSIAGVAGLPIIGWVIDNVGWRSPFLIISFLSLIAAAMIWFRLPAVTDRAHRGQSLAGTWSVFLKPNVLAAMGVGGLLFLAAGCFVTVWGIWLSEDFGLGAVTLGVVATAIGLAELGGVTMSSLLIDRIEKRRGSQAGLLLTTLAFLSLPFTQGSLFFAILVLALMGACVEFAILSLFPLYSEQAPEARATIFSLVGLGISIGLALGSPIAAILWQQVGLGAVCGIAIICLLLAMFLVWRYLPEG
jgi:predicted MFS family arabinose efflux permease